jgi:glycosyltransferase involved in cell wall biosynthesis
MKRYTLRRLIHDVKVLNQLRLEYRRTKKNQRKDVSSDWPSRYSAGMRERVRAWENWSGDVRDPDRSSPVAGQPEISGIRSDWDQQYAELDPRFGYSFWASHLPVIPALAARAVGPGGGFQTMRDISVIFPAFNEEENIRCTVETAINVLREVAKRWEVIVVDDGSSDTTAVICDQLKARYPEVAVIRHGQNRGYGAALKSGIMSARYDLVFFSDSDGQFNLREIEQLICWSKDYDIVAGYRAKRRDPFHRRVNALGWNMLVRLVLGIKVRDIDCAFKLFRRDVFDRIQIRCVGAMVNTEILAQAIRLGMRIREVKVSHFPRRYGKQSGANVRVIVKAFRELSRLWRKLRRVTPSQAGLYSAREDVDHSWCMPFHTPPCLALRIRDRTRKIISGEPGVRGVASLSFLWNSYLTNMNLADFLLEW